MIYQILMHQIRATLPDIKARISQNLQKINAELLSLGGHLGDALLTAYCAISYNRISEPLLMVIPTTFPNSNELSGGAMIRISFIFHELMCVSSFFPEIYST